MFEYFISPSTHTTDSALCRIRKKKKKKKRELWADYDHLGGFDDNEHYSAAADVTQLFGIILSLLENKFTYFTINFLLLKNIRNYELPCEFLCF